VRAALDAERAPNAKFVAVAKSFVFFLAGIQVMTINAWCHC
jgi:hypothetical protein